MGLRDQRVVAGREDVGVEGAASEGAQHDPVARRAPGPLRGHPRHREQASRLAAGDDEAHPAAGMCDAIARIAERDGRARHGAQLVARAGEHRVERRDEPRRHRRRHGQHPARAATSRPLAATTRYGLPGVIPATGSRVRIAAAGRVRVSAAGSWPMPPRRPRNAPSPSGAPARAASSARMLPPAASASASGGESARSDRRSTSPAWMPPSSGWAIRRVNASPNRLVVKAPTDSSSVVGRREPARRSHGRRGRAPRRRASSGPRPRRASAAARAACPGGKRAAGRSPARTRCAAIRSRQSRRPVAD